MRCSVTSRGKHTKGVKNEGRTLLFLGLFIEPVRNFVFVSHTIPRKGGNKYGKEENPGV